MLLVVQFPIAVGRLFAQAGASRLTVPAWPLAPGVNSEFVRSFGPAVRRLRGGDAAWADEGLSCSAGKAIRFPALRTHRFTAGDRQLQPLCAFRRTFSDVKTVTRVEVGLVLSRDPQLAPSIPELLRVANNARGGSKGEASSRNPSVNWPGDNRRREEGGWRCVRCGASGRTDNVGGCHRPEALRDRPALTGA